jgi:cyanophycinase
MDRFTYGDGESYDYMVANRLKQRHLTEVKSADSPFGEGKAGGYTNGFDFLSAIDAGTDTHVDARGRYGRVLVAMRTLKYPFGLALAENTALAVKGHVGMAYGQTHVFVADGRHATYGAEGPYSAQGVMVSLLAPHAAFDFERGRITGAGAPLGPSTAPAPACPADVLAGASLPDEMRAFALSTTPSLCCLTHEGGKPTFQFTLRRGPDTRAFGPTTGLSVQGLELAVSPCPVPKESR